MKLIDYFRSVIKEIKLVEFPTIQDVKVTSFVVVLLLIIMVMFIGFNDFIISKIMKFLLGIL